jgi:hypothetical protein
MYSHAMVTVHDVSTVDANSDPAPIAVLYGPDAESTAAAVETFKARGRTWAAMADIGGAVHIYDITDILKSGHPAPLVASWYTPVSPLDGTHEIAVDIEIQREQFSTGPAQITAYVSMFRGGIAVLDLSSPANPVSIEIMDTPGLAEGLSFDRADGRPRLLVGDREGGVRVLRAR